MLYGHIQVTLKYACGAAALLLLRGAWVSYQALAATQSASAIVVASSGVSAWASAVAMLHLLGLTVLGGLFYAALRRHKRWLMFNQAALLLLYSAALVMACATYFSPARVDPNLAATCDRVTAAGGSGGAGASERLVRMCSALPRIDAQLATHMAALLQVGALLAAACLAVLLLGTWLHFEISWLERRAVKHKRRHRRRKHTIPWDKIKIIGPVTNCGANKPPAGADTAPNGAAAAANDANGDGAPQAEAKKTK